MRCSALGDEQRKIKASDPAELWPCLLEGTVGRSASASAVQCNYVGSLRARLCAGAPASCGLLLTSGLAHLQARRRRDAVGCMLGVYVMQADAQANAKARIGGYSGGVMIADMAFVPSDTMEVTVDRIPNVHRPIVIIPASYHAHSGPFTLQAVADFDFKLEAVTADSSDSLGNRHASQLDSFREQAARR